MTRSKTQMIIGVFFGSRNPEHEVSIITGQFAISELRKLGYDIIPVYIDKKGRWFSNEELGYLKFFTDANFENKLNKMNPCFIDINAKNQKLVLKTKGILSKETTIDLVFPTFHGMNGEDGAAQGIFELCNVPYVGCDVASSAMAMDKILTKQMYKSADITTTPFLCFGPKEWESGKENIIGNIKKLKWPVFVKPARLGSSIGITKVQNLDELENACEIALHYDTKIIVEESVENLMDITCAVLGNNDPKPSLIQESVFEGGHFSYEDKYIEGGGAQLGNAENKIVIPARLDEEISKEVQNMAVKIFKLFGCSGMARIDFLYDKANKRVYANEINTLPGTLYHHLWKASGIETGDLLEKLIGFAKERHKEKNNITETFNSDVLKFANSVKLQMRNDEKQA